MVFRLKKTKIKKVTAMRNFSGVALPLPVPSLTDKSNGRTRRGITAPLRFGKMNDEILGSRQAADPLLPHGHGGGGVQGSVPLEPTSTDVVAGGFDNDHQLPLAHGRPYALHGHARALQEQAWTNRSHHDYNESVRNAFTARVNVTQTKGMESVYWFDDRSKALLSLGSG